MASKIYTVEVGGVVALTTNSAERALRRYHKHAGQHGTVLKCDGKQLTTKQIEKLEN